MSTVDGTTREYPVRVVMIEDYALIREGIVALLNGDEHVKVVGEAENAEEGLELVKSLKPHVVLMDLGLPGMDGAEATRQIKEFDSNIKVIILTSQETEALVLEALMSGANAYCLKTMPSHRLAEIVQYVYEGAAWLDPSVAQVALNLFMTPGFAQQFSKSTAEGPTSPLAGRETDVLRLLVQGKNNNEIAEELFVSVHTVKAHVSSILQKMAVQDRVSAAVKAVQAGLV